MKHDDMRFRAAYGFAFERVFACLRDDLAKIFHIATHGGASRQNEFLSVSAGVLVMTAIKTMARFDSFRSDARDDVQQFVDKYFPEYYRWLFKKIYRCYEDGMLHYYAVKSDEEMFRIRFLLQAPKGAFSGLKELKDSRRQAFEEKTHGELHVHPQILYLDLLDAVEKFRLRLVDPHQGRYRVTFYRNYEKITETAAKVW